MWRLQWEWEKVQDITAPSAKEDKYGKSFDLCHDFELKLNGKMQMIVVLMIDKVVFGDGTTYNAETTSKALGEFFEKE